METIHKIKAGTIKITLGFARIILFLMVALVMVEVIMRWGFNKSTMISTDFVAYGMGIVFYWGASKAMEDDVFVRMDILYDLYKGKFKKVINIIFDFILLFFNCNIMYFFFILLQNTFTRNLKSTNIFQTPLWVPRLLLFIGIVIFNVYMICRIIEDIYAKPQEKSDRDIRLVEGISEGGKKEEQH